jgi:MATE family multidrug resistance protein
MLAAGIAAAATIRVGNQLGRRDKVTLRAAGFTSYLMSIALMAISALIFITARYFLAGLYIDDQSVIDLAAQLLIIAAFFQLSDGIQVVGLGALRGMADVKVPTLITLVAYWILGLPIGYVLAFVVGWGPHGIWIGLLIGLTVAAILLSIRFHYVSNRIIKA